MNQVFIFENVSMPGVYLMGDDGRLIWYPSLELADAHHHTMAVIGGKRWQANWKVVELFTGHASAASKPAADPPASAARAKNRPNRGAPPPAPPRGPESLG